MKGVQSIGDAVSKGKVLQKEKETETNWNKIDAVLERLCKAQEREEALVVLEIIELVCASVQSNRSKLSGTGCKCMTRLFEVLKEEMKEYLPNVLPAVMSALGKANKVISSRAMCTVHMIGDTCPLVSMHRYIRTIVTSPSKSIRQGVLELIIRNIKVCKSKELFSVVEEYTEDPVPEIRSRAREGLKLISEQNTAVLLEISSKPPKKTEEIVSVVSELRQSVSYSSQKSKPASADNTLPQPSVITNVPATGRIPQLRTQSTGNTILVKGPVRSFMSLKPIEIHRIKESKPPSTPKKERVSLKPGDSLERLGARLQEHQKGVQEVLRREYSLRCTPIKKLRVAKEELTEIECTTEPHSTETNGLPANPFIDSQHSHLESTLTLREEENREGDDECMLISNVSTEIMNLTINKTEDTENIVENKDVQSSIFEGAERKGTQTFLDSCIPMASNDASFDNSDYTFIAPGVSIKKSTTRKL
ncbi:hypothetical protein NEOKW01_0509 [Nematocida sp. AWRm80]|nr:hypothetical protein NEOKW01_0509 [Nematocida sp. AWRm80]